MLCFASPAVRAQGGSVAKGPDPSVIKDPELEKEMLHNLEAARHYFKMKKAYRASLARAEEIVVGYPQFSRLDEALYIAGMSSLYLSESKGKQSATAPPEKLREDAQEYLSRLNEEFPDSDFKKKAGEALSALGVKKVKAVEQQ